jgi:serine/threonine-protein kinase HipA
MDILVYADWSGIEDAQVMGTLTVTRTKGRSVFSFNYAQSWLEGPHAQTLDPDLQLYAGAQYLPSSKPNFGVFLDSSPDRWGRVLMDRREALIAKNERRRPNKLFEEDYLLGVYDEHRMGALRFKTAMEGPFLNDNQGFASLQLEKGALRDEEALRWINMLLAPGASLGGARPKASVLDPHGQLWIAKFPSVRDAINIGAWEMVAYQLASIVGIRMSPAQARRFNSDHHTFMAQRFDRKRHDRLHFASAMTLLGHQDGDTGVSYLELVEFIQRQGANVKNDLEELFRRIVFNIGIKNTDDHLRNHGFMLTPQGWSLSPAYDVNPIYFGTGLTLNISESDNALEFELARSVARFFRLTDKQAVTIIEQVKTAREKWQELASSLGVSRNEQEMMERAFSEG